MASGNVGGGDLLSVRPARHLEGELPVPGDKSISHRAVLLAAAGRGVMEVLNPSPADDVQRSVDAIRALGVRGAETKGQAKPELSQLSSRTLRLFGESWEGLTSPTAPLDAGNSGTTIRILLGLLAGGQATATLTGDSSLRRRPMDRVVEPLRRMGARIRGESGGAFAPLTVEGTALSGADHDLPVPSAQVKTALLLAGLEASGRTSVHETPRSRDHTERMLKYLGVQVTESNSRLIVERTNFSNAPVEVPGDFSSAAFLLAAAAILDGSQVRLPGIGLNPTRLGFLELLERYGALATIEERAERCGEPRGTIALRAGDRRPLRVEPGLVPRCIDELPLVAVLGALAEGDTEVRGAAELRVKESDRIEALAEGLGAMGGRFEPLPDGFVVRGEGRLRGARVDAHGDHRVAMALAVAGLAAQGETVIEGWSCVGVSYPGFERDLGRLVVR